LWKRLQPQTESLAFDLRKKKKKGKFARCPLEMALPELNSKMCTSAMAGEMFPFYLV
jgi:hypothetical protein